MKTIILILLFSISQAQTKCDSVLFENKATIENIQLNLEKSHDEFVLGTGLVAVGLWIRVMAVTGKEYHDMSEKNKKNCFLLASAFELTGICFVVYSHTYINKASLKVSPTKLTYTFK